MKLGRIVVYPIKSFDGVEVSAARIGSGGGLEHDRAYAWFDAQGRVVNGKRAAQIQRIRSAASEDFAEVEVWSEDDARRVRFGLAERTGIERWFSDFMGFSAHLRHDPAGFPDDREAAGPTVTSRESLVEVAGWFGTDGEAMRARFRGNLELTGGPAFAEDRLFAAEGELRRFNIGGVEFFGVNPCQRCVVPARNPLTGESEAGFQNRFRALRETTLPEWADRRRFNHFYRFAVNTRLSPKEAGKELRVGDELGV